MSAFLLHPHGLLLITLCLSYCRWPLCRTWVLAVPAVESCRILEKAGRGRVLAVSLQGEPDFIDEADRGGSGWHRLSGTPE